MGTVPSTPSPEQRLERVLDVFDRLWHRCRIHAPTLTESLPSPHELRTGVTADEFRTRMERLRAGEHLHEQEASG